MKTLSKWTEPYSSLAKEDDLSSEEKKNEENRSYSKKII